MSSVDGYADDSSTNEEPSVRKIRIKMEDDDISNIDAMLNNFMDRKKTKKTKAQVFYDKDMNTETITRRDTNSKAFQDEGQSAAIGANTTGGNAADADSHDTTNTVDTYAADGADGADAADVESDYSTDLIDLSPGESVARITNQIISERDDDVSRMRRHRTIAKTDREEMIRRSSRNRTVKSKRKVRYPYGYLKVVCGSMYSGKSSHLKIDKNDWSSISGIQILVINYVKDDRYTSEDMVMTHNREGVKCVSVERLAEITNGDCYDEFGNVVLPQNYDLILIDEAQFYDDLRDNVIYWVDILCKTVFAYGLDGDFRRKTFGQIHEIIPLADEYIKKKANCMMCNNGTEGLFTWRLEGNDAGAETIQIGAETVYVSLCRKHYKRVNPPKVMITGQVHTIK